MCKTVIWELAKSHREPSLVLCDNPEGWDGGRGRRRRWEGIYIHMLCYAKSLQSCPTLCDPIDRSPPGSPDPGILQARTLEWAAISFSNAWKWKVKVKLLSRVRLLATPWTAAYQVPPSMGFSRQEYWSGVPLPSPFICFSIGFHQLQFYVGFYCTTTWISHKYIYIQNKTNKHTKKNK